MESTYPSPQAEHELLEMWGGYEDIQERMADAVRRDDLALLSQIQIQEDAYLAKNPQIMRFFETAYAESDN